MDANVESIRNLKENLKDHGVVIDKVPYVLQMNKRDLPTAVAVPELDKALRIKDEPVFEAVASRGTGVFETLKAVVKAVLMDLNAR
jgi:hypothetical protein